MNLVDYAVLSLSKWLYQFLGNLTKKVKSREIKKIWDSLICAENQNSVLKNKKKFFEGREENCNLGMNINSMKPFVWEFNLKPHGPISRTKNSWLTPVTFRTAGAMAAYSWW